MWKSPDYCRHLMVSCAAPSKFLQWLTKTRTSSPIHELGHLTMTKSDYLLSVEQPQSWSTCVSGICLFVTIESIVVVVGNQIRSANNKPIYLECPLTLRTSNPPPPAIRQHNHNRLRCISK